MTSSDQPEIERIGADGTKETPSEPTNKVLVANIPGDDPSKFVVLTLSNPLNERDRVRLGLPADASTETGQKVAVNRNGAQIIINAGYATIDPEDRDAVRSALRGEENRLSSAAEPAEPAEPAKPWYDVEVDETTTPDAPESGTGGTPMDPPQPGADEDGFGGDAPAPADPPQGEPMVEPAAEGMMSPLDAPSKAPSTPGSTDPLTEAEAAQDDAPAKPADKSSNKRR